MAAPQPAGLRPPSIATAGDACFAELQSHYEAYPGSEVPDHILASLHFLFGKNLLKALEVVEGGGIVCYVGQATGRRVFKVPGRRPSDRYTVFPAHHCTCQSFQFDVVHKGEQVCCKHQLAARLAGAMGRVAAVPLPDLDLARLLLEECA